jgi:hypothetical protein
MKTVLEQIELMRKSLDLLQDSLSPDELEASADDAPIKDMLAFKGSVGDAFYNTIQHYLKTWVISIGDDEFPSGLIIRLTDEVGLQVVPNYNGDKTGRPFNNEEWGIWLDLQFVPMPSEVQYNSLKDPIKPLGGWVTNGWRFLDDKTDND